MRALCLFDRFGTHLRHFAHPARMRALCLFDRFGTPLRGEGLRPLLLLAGGEAGDIAGASQVARSWALFAHLDLAPRCATCPALPSFIAPPPTSRGHQRTPRPRSGGSPREGARSEPASGAATGGGGPQAPPTLSGITTRAVFRRSWPRA